MRRVKQGDSENETAPWPNGAEHFVVLHKEIQFTEADGYDETVAFEKGDEIPPELVTPGLWRGVGDRLAAVSGVGERLDRPSVAERGGAIDADGALNSWRSEKDLRRGTVEVYVCEVCDSTFETLDALNGHQSAHTEDSDDTDEPENPGGDPSTETLADKLDTEDGGETA